MKTLVSELMMPLPMLPDPIENAPSCSPRSARSAGKSTFPRLPHDSNDGGPHALSPMWPRTGFSAKATCPLSSDKGQMLVSGWYGARTVCPLLVRMRTRLVNVYVLISQIDVIMVWHAYMLNPRDFLEDCLRQGKMRFWRAGLPWAVIDPCINNNTFEYCASEAAMESFEDRTGFKWDSLHDPPNATIECCSCGRKLYVPWTRWNSERAWTHSDSPGSAELYGESLAAGVSDKSFEVQCQCGVVVTHEYLRIQKFRRDIKTLHNSDVPMPGTILNHNGMHLAFWQKATATTHSNAGIPEVPVGSRHPSLFPNRLIEEPKKLLYSTLVTMTVPHNHSKKMTDVRSEIERSLKDRACVKRANGTSTHILARAEKIAIRRMMSRYWDNSSPFALDLVSAVIRQGSFVEKMHSIDWIHSPAATSTMARLIQKYTRFMAIIAFHPERTAVPTLDVDLAWHTHQLSPPFYYAYTVIKTSRFIDHDDKIEETALSTAFEWTSKTYQKLYNQLYSECTCWYCEAIRESHTSSVKRVFGGNKAIESQLDRLHSGNQDPNTSPHISAHGAIKADSDESQRVRDMSMKCKLERDYQKACKHARKQGRSPPKRDQRDGSYYAMAYGYPMYVPYYAPYMGDPCVNGGFYAANPACANFTAGAVGNCCAGACGGGVAAGACGGGGSGGCAGGAAGGCGGGGGGGCGGGGGGGGGCGGGGGGGCGGGG